MCRHTAYTLHKDSSFHLPNKGGALTFNLEIRSSRKGLRELTEFTQLCRIRTHTGPAAAGDLARHDFAVLSLAFELDAFNSHRSEEDSIE